jgi:hypothetical protein
VQLPDGQDRSAQINGARVVPLPSAALCLTSVGPPPVVLFYLPPFPCCRVSSTHLSLVVLVALLSPITHSSLATHPLLSTSVSHPKASPFLLSSSHLPGCLLPRIIPYFPPLSSLSLLTITPTIHHILCDGPHVRPSSHSVVPSGSARSIPYLEMLSWLGRYQSQEAVIEAVGGG